MALLLDHLGLDAPAQTSAGGEGFDAGAPLLLPIDLVDEDPDQPRTEFDAEALQELAQTIAARGVRQPVSVRPHPKVPGRWMLNFGARRLRATRLAGRAEIPAFVDATADSYDQVIENEQRAALQPLELALFVKRRLGLGESQAAVARGLGKSRSYLSYVSALIDPPDWLLDLYRSGRCRGLTELYELRRLHQADGPALMRWLDHQGQIGRTDIQAYKRQGVVAAEAVAPLDTPPASTMPAASSTGGPGVGKAVVVPLRVVQPPAACSSAPAVAQPQSGPLVLWALHGDDEVVIDLSTVPDGPGQVYVRLAGPGQGGRRIAVEARRLTLLRVTRPNHEVV